MSKDSQFEDLIASALPELPSEARACFTDYYHLVIKWNQRISLTTLTSPREFVGRHLVEAHLASSLVGTGIARFWDIGSGVGIPGIPVAVLRPDLTVKLIESNRKKAIFLEEAIDALGLKNTEVMNVRFEALSGFGATDCVALRAVERMEKVVESLEAVARDAGQLLIFGGLNLKVKERTGRKLRRHPIPGSDATVVYEP
jgi:16S rRNA (guanine527-N7)-methyltransferase